MSETEIELGPIDWVIVEWPPGKEPNGKGLDMLVDLTERGIIRVLDIAFVRKNEDGSVSGAAIGDFDADGTLDLALFEGASSGVLGQEDYDEAGNALEAGASAAILVYENTWAAPFATNLRKTGARLVDERTHSDQRVHRRARRARGGRGLDTDDRREQTRCHSYAWRPARRSSPGRRPRFRDASIGARRTAGPTRRLTAVPGGAAASSRWRRRPQRPRPTTSSTS